MPLTPFILELMARTAYGEASGEGYDGQRAIIHVIYNRAEQHKFSPLEAILHGPAFSCWNALLEVNGKTVANPDRIRIARAAEDDPVLVQCRALAADPGADLTDGATNYHVIGLKPDWAASMQCCGIIGKHVFYKDAPKVA